MATINQVVYEYLYSDSTMSDNFNKVFYLINDNEKYAPYAVTYLLDDAKERPFLCNEDEGQARFQCEVYDTDIKSGIDKREIFQSVMKALIGQELSGINIWNVTLTNVSDRDSRINGLFALTFEAIVDWEK